MQISVYGLCWVMLGGALGGVARFYLSGVVGRRVGETFPWGTMMVNVTGSFAIGVIAALAQGDLLPLTPTGWQVAVTGFLGCYTTVSSFSLQTLSLVREGEHLQALANIAGTLVLCLGAVSLGFLSVAGLL